MRYRKLSFPEDNAHFTVVCCTTVMKRDTTHDILQIYPQIVENECLVIRSDNSSTQYKPRFTFGLMQAVAQKYNVDVLWFYGAPGHDRALVDAMSSFDCKDPLRKAIITEDKYFLNANEMHSYLFG